MFSGDENVREKRTVGEEKITVIKVYTSKERAQCQDASGRPLSETKEELEDAGMRVYASECGVLTGLMNPALCGATTLHINIHGIDEQQLSDAEEMGYRSLESLEDDIGYETQSCE